MKALACLLIACLMSCSTTKKLIPAEATFDLEGHRGCRGLMPENTVPAMLHAIDLGVNTLEMDVVVTKDDQLVLSHEPWMNADIATKPDGMPVTVSEASSLNIYKMAYEDIKHFDVGLRGNPRFPQQKKMAVYKPLLTEVIKKTESYAAKHVKKIRYNIETKCSPEGDNVFHPLPEKFIELLLLLLKEHGITERSIIQSFDKRSLQYLHKVDPGVSTALLIDENDKLSVEDHLKDLGFVPAIYSPHYSLVSQDLVTYCHDKKIKVIPWTVNNLETMRKLRLLGVDGLISDYPDLYKDL